MGFHTFFLLHFIRYNFQLYVYCVKSVLKSVLKSVFEITAIEALPGFPISDKPTRSRKKGRSDAGRGVRFLYSGCTLVVVIILFPRCCFAGRSYVPTVSFTDFMSRMRQSRLLRSSADLLYERVCVCECGSSSFTMGCV